MSTLSTRLKEARAAASLTQEQLAKAAKNGLTANDISKAERALYVPTDAQLKAIAKATGVTQKSLLDAKSGTAAKKPAASSAAKKPASSAAKKPTASSAAKKPAASSAAKKPAASSTGTSMKVTATEKKLVEAYRKASAENKKLAMNLLQGKAVEESQFNIGSLFSGGLGGSVSEFFENLVKGINQ